MHVSGALLIGLEEALNRVLNTDQVTRDRLATLHGRRIAINLEGWLVLHFIADANGRLQLFTGAAEEAEAVITATPFDFAETAMADRQEDQVFKGKVRLTGNIRLAEEFSAILRGFEFDWEEQLSKLAGDVVAHQVGNNLRGVLKWAYRGRKHLGQAFGEYVTEEKQLLPTRFEFEEWRDAVDDTRDAVERLEARIRLLSSKLQDSDK